MTSHPLLAIVLTLGATFFAAWAMRLAAKIDALREENEALRAMLTRARADARAARRTDEEAARAFDAATRGKR